MNELKKNAWLLLVIIVLFIAKFAVIPILDWQNNKLAQIKLLTKKQQKIENVLANRVSNKEKNYLLATMINETDNMFFDYESDSVFKLFSQKYLQELLVKHDLKVQNIGFLTQTPLQDLEVIKFPVQITFSGNTTDTIAFITEIESSIQRVSVEDFNYSLKGQVENNLGVVNGNITLALFANVRNQVLGDDVQ